MCLRIVYWEQELKYNFRWDSEKLKKNLAKHKVSFELAVTLFKDPHAITIYDDEHSTKEERWITLGLSSNKTLLVLHHTFESANKNTVVIRVISCRKANKNEEKQYKEL